MSEDAPFFENDPPHWAARGLAWVLLALFVVAVLFVTLVKIPERVSSPFVLVPVNGTDPVRALDNAVVTQVGVREGQAVRKGDLLFMVRSDPVGDRSSEAGALETEIANADAKTANATEQFHQEQLADDEEKTRLQTRIADLDRMMALKKKQLELTKDLASRYETMKNSGYSSHEQIIQHELATHAIDVEIAEAQADRHEAQAGLDKLGYDMQAREVRYREQIRSLREDNEKSSIRMKSLREDPLRNGNGVMNVSSPCDATVIRQPIKAPGAVVMEGDILAELACAGEPLQAELSIPPAKTGRIVSGEPVKLYYDAFPYQRYGVRYATLSWVSPASTQAGSSPEAFRALAPIVEASVTTPEGRRQLRAGMGGTAQVIIGRRTLISYAFEPLRAIRENLAAPPVAPAPTAGKEPGNAAAR